MSNWPEWTSPDGSIRLINADCLEVLPTLQGKVDATITDPPYGVNLGKHDGSKDKREKHLAKQGYETYEDTPENYRAIVVPAIETCISISRRAMVYGMPPMIWHLPAPDVIGGSFMPSAVGRNPWGFSSLSHCLLYGKAAEIQRGCYATAFSSTDAAEQVGHPTKKPIRWMLWAVKLGSKPGETVLDPFMGSGTTGEACIRLGRKFIGIEKEPKYFEIAKQQILDELNRAPLFDLPTPTQTSLLPQ